MLVFEQRHPLHRIGALTITTVDLEALHVDIGASIVIWSDRAKLMSFHFDRTVMNRWVEHNRRRIGSAREREAYKTAKLPIAASSASSSPSGASSSILVAAAAIASSRVYDASLKAAFTVVDAWLRFVADEHTVSGVARPDHTVQVDANMSNNLNELLRTIRSEKNKRRAIRRESGLNIGPGEEDDVEDGEWDQLIEGDLEQDSDAEGEAIQDAKARGSRYGKGSEVVVREAKSMMTSKPMSVESTVVVVAHAPVSHSIETLCPSSQGARNDEGRRGVDKCKDDEHMEEIKVDESKAQQHKVDEQVEKHVKDEETGESVLYGQNKKAKVNATGTT